MHACVEPREHRAHARAVLWTLGPTLARERWDHPIEMRLQELWPKPLAGAEGGSYPRHPLKGAALMRELPKQECKGIDIRTILKADERAAQAAAAAAAAATTVATIAALARVTFRLLQSLGCHISQCAPRAHRIPAFTIRVLEAEARQPEVGELAYRLVRVEQCILRLDVVVQDAVRVEEAQPARPRDILTRVLRNLKEIFSSQSDWERLVLVMDRLIILNPEALFEVRDRGLALIELGHKERALKDLLRYVEELPNASDALAVKQRLASLQTD